MLVNYQAAKNSGGSSRILPCTSTCRQSLLSFQSSLCKFEVSTSKRMRITSAIICFALLASCSKDKFTNEPQITFNGFNMNVVGSDITSVNIPPHVKLDITDGDGDLGIVAGKDTAFIYLKNVLNGREDSVAFPDLGSAARKNFEAQLEVSLFDVLGGRTTNIPPRPYVDTLFFEVYVRDFNRNKSNVIITSEPFYYITR